MVGPLEAVPAPRHPLTPRPVPSAPVAPGVDPPAAGTGSAPSAGAAGDGDTRISDEDRNRYGVLLDRAADRGLLSPADYQVRLGELAEATTIEEMHRIVTDLPVFAAPPAKTNGGSRRRSVAPWGSAARGATAHAPWVGTPSDRSFDGRGRWLVLAVLVAVLVVSLVVLAVFAAHLTHVRSTGLPVWRPWSGATGLSALRL